MIVIIGLVPEEVGNALASPIQTPGVSCSSPHGFGDARLRVGAHPAGAHLVGGEQPEAAGAQRHALEPLDERVEVVAHAPLGHAGGERRDPARAGGLVQAHLRLERAVRVAHVAARRSSEYQGTAWPASSIVTRPAPWSRTRPMNVAP